MIFGIVLHRTEWRIGYLGPSTPVQELARAARAARPDLVVLAATAPEALEQVRPELTALARHVPLALAGAGATPELASATGARLMTRDPVTEAEQTRWPR
jgi:MerR family transcriptional regulator, light-induced transcriptional regulator